MTSPFFPQLSPDDFKPVRGAGGDDTENSPETTKEVLNLAGNVANMSDPKVHNEKLIKIGFQGIQTKLLVHILVDGHVFYMLEEPRHQ